MGYPQKLKAVVFDLDDTLYPECQYVHSGFLAVGKFLEDHRVCSNEEFYVVATQVSSEGYSGRVFDEALKRIGVTQSLEELLNLVQVYRQHEPKIYLYPDAVECLILLSQKFQLGMITDGPAIAQRRKVAALEIRKWIDHIIYTDDDGRIYWKPHPKPYLDLQKILNTEPQSILYVGDNPTKDFFGARRVGWTSIRIRREETLHYGTKPSPGYEPDFEFTSLSKLAEWLDNTQ